LIRPAAYPQIGRVFTVEAAGLEPHPQELVLEEISAAKWPRDPVDESGGAEPPPGSTTYPWWTEDGADMGCPLGSSDH
jgi:hypothetical protein